MSFVQSPAIFFAMSSERITELLVAWSNGDESSLDRLVPLVESELTRIARGYLRRENANCSLQVSDLINEAYIKLIHQHSTNWKGSSHFYAVASIVMRRILVNHARDKRAGKRGGATVLLNVDETEILLAARTEDLISLDEALMRLAEFDKLRSRIVEMRYFGGLTGAEAAEVLGMTPAAVTRQWNLARAWLARQIAK